MIGSNTSTVNRTFPRMVRDAWPLLPALALLTAGAILLATPAMGAYEDDSESYGFVSRVQGDVLLAGLEQADAVDAEVNHPLLTGDQISTNTGRAEVVLPDGSIVRVDRATSVVFEALGGSPDSEPESGTLLLLDDGALQIRTPEVLYGGGEFAIRTTNATVYLAAAGSYRVKSRGTSFTEVVVREGFAEADTRSGSAVARSAEALEVSGYGRPFVEVLAAGPENALEIWAGDLDRQAYASSNDYVDPRLSYAAEPLHDNGEWLVVESRRVWRPYVRADWRPFRHGRWVYTPSGLTWVASAPWGWVTSHYGSWDYFPGHGWLWYPGHFYRPAAVYWYWGPTYVGWIPHGYYNRYYGFAWGSGYGVYGWAGGDWGLWADWTFCPTRYFGRRGYDRYWDSGRNLARTRRFAVPRGVVTTDTRGVTRDRWGKPNEVHEVLGRRGRNGERSASLRELPDVTDFVARRELSQARLQEVKDTRARSVKERLRPLADDGNRARFTTPSAGRGRTESVGRSRTGVSRDLSRDRSGTAVRGTESRRSQTNSGRGTLNRPGASERSLGTRDRESVRDRGSDAESGSATRGRVRDLSGGRDLDDSRQRTDDGGARGRSSSLRDDSGSAESAPARRVLDSIREHRETRGRALSSRDDSKGSRSSTRSKTPDRGSSARGSESSSRARGSSSSVSRGSSSRGSSSSTSKGSSTSARGSDRSSSSKSGEARRSSPPPRQSSARSSSNSGSRSRSVGRSSNSGSRSRSVGRSSERSNGGRSQGRSTSRSRVRKPH